MEIHYSEAKPLCTAAEFALVEDTRPRAVGQFALADLRKRITQARKLADKWREQAAREEDPNNSAGIRSQVKHELFKQILRVFEERLSELETTAPPQTSAKPASGKTHRLPTSGKSKRRKRPLARQARQNATTSGLSARIRGHVSARGRRDQAARSPRNRS